MRLGPKAAAQTLAALLTETVSGSTSLTHPSSAARAAHVLIIAALNLVKVEVAPLPRPQDLPPVALLLAQQQVIRSAHDLSAGRVVLDNLVVDRSETISRSSVVQ